MIKRIRINPKSSKLAEMIFSGSSNNLAIIHVNKTELKMEHFKILKEQKCIIQLVTLDSISV